MSDWREQREIHEIRIELRSTASRDDLERRLRTSAAVIPTCAGDRVERVGDARDPSFDRNAPPAKATWISGTVPVLVVS
jgi:hypothetical protein